MKKLFTFLLICGLVLSMAACGKTQPEVLGDIAAVETPPESSLLEASGTDLTPTEDTPQESAAPDPEPVKVDDTEVMDAYRAFLAENYERLYDACYGGISGIGFIDLDCDGYREMLIFDAGASASMGVQFFDVADGKVECISANMQPMGDAFGGSHFTKVYVNANHFEDFRLVEVVDTGERFFLVESSNGSLEFFYRELIRFGRDENNVLTLTPLFYSYEEYDEESGNVISSNHRIDGSDATENEYSNASSSFLGSILDLSLECSGVFAWTTNNSAQYEGRDGFLKMAEDAIALSENNALPPPPADN